jgi:hypothetical protein
VSHPPRHPYRQSEREPKPPSLHSRRARGDADVEIAALVCAGLALGAGCLAGIARCPPALVAAAGLVIVWALRGLVTTLRRR